MSVKGIIKFLLVIILFVSILVFGGGYLYLKGFPELLNSPKVVTYLETILAKALGAEVEINNPSLKTEKSPIVYLKAKSIIIKNDNKILLQIKNPDLDLSLASIFSKNIVIKKLDANYIYANISSLLELPLFKNTSTSPGKWNADVFRSVVNVKKAKIFYQIDKENSVDLNANNIEISDDDKKKAVRYDLKMDLCREKKFCLDISTSETGNNTYILNKKQLVINNSSLKVEKSNVLMNGTVDFKGNYKLNFKGKNFSVVDTMEILDTQIVENNLENYFGYFKDIDGNYNFNVDMDNKGITGKIKLNKLGFKLIPLENLPVLFTQGDVSFDNDKINLKNFKGKYNYRNENKMDFEGTVKDYLKSVDTNLVGNAIVTDDFAKNYLSKIISYPVGIKGRADTRVILKSKNNKIDITWLYMFKKGTGFIVDGEEPELNKVAHRVIVAKMAIEGLLLKIKSLDYHLANEDGKPNKDRTPIISLKGDIDFSNINNPLKNLNLSLTKPMPSAFLNLLMKENIFKGGTFTGHMELINHGTYPYLQANLKANEVHIPTQRLYLKDAEITSRKNILNIKAHGAYRKSKYYITSDIENKVTFPIIVKNLNITLDNLDVEKYLQALNEHNSSGQASDNVQKTITQSNSSESFDLANLIVEKGSINIKNGNYKKMNFSDMTGDLSFDKNSVLTVKTNRFNIAEGSAQATSTNDLKKHKYNLSLAVIGVNSDLIASELVNLPQEINGKASGIMELNTDETLRLNGNIKFIVQNGVIAKMGLVEYTMKVASLFRNPFVMITPAVISDLANVPEGRFERINGDLTIENNVIRRLVIKSISPQLSTYIIGRYNLHNQDAILRIYTKFSNKRKGAFGFLRSISLNTLANRIPLNTKNNSNYYAAEITELPKIDAEDNDIQIFLTTVDGDIVTNNFISSLKKIK